MENLDNFGFVEDKNSGLIYVGGIESNKWLNDEKELSRNYKQGYRIYDCAGVSCTITKNGGGIGGNTGLYLVSGDEDGGYQEGIGRHDAVSVPTEKRMDLSLLELFSGVGCQWRGLENSGCFNLRRVGTSEIEADAVIGYAVLHNGMTEELVQSYDCPSEDEMVAYLNEHGIGGTDWCISRDARVRQATENPDALASGMKVAS